MKTVELKPREFHRRIGWALAEARRGVAVVIAAPGQPAVTLTLGRPIPVIVPASGARFAATIAEMTCIGSLLIIAIGLNMLKVTKIKIMNYILAVFLPILLCLFM